MQHPANGGAEFPRFVPRPDTFPVTVYLEKQYVDALNDMAEQSEMTTSGIIRSALRIKQAFEMCLKDGGKVVFLDKDGNDINDLGGPHGCPALD